MLADATANGSPVIAGPFKERCFWPPQKGEDGWKEEYEGIAR